MKKMMKEINLLSKLIMITCLLQSCSKNIISEEISVLDYSSIELNVPGEIEYSQILQGNSYFKITVDEDIFHLLDIQNENNCLKINSKNGVKINPSVLKIISGSKNLNQINISGSGKIYLKNILKSENIDINISGSGKLQSKNLYCGNFNLKIIGSGEVKLKGVSKNAHFLVKGPGCISAKNYIVQDLNCKIIGSGKIDASVINSLKASVVGSGEIVYRGNPQVNKEIIGSGNIKDR